LIGLVSELVQYAPYALIALIVVLVLLKWPFAGLLAMIALIPGEELTTFFAGRTLIWILGIAVLGAWALRALLAEERIQIAKRPTLMALLWLMWGLLSVFWAQDQAAALGRAVTLAQLITLFCLIQVMITDNQRLRMLLTAYFVVSVFFALLAIGTYIPADLKRAILTEAQNPNALGRGLGIGLLMTPYLLGQLRSVRWRIAAWLGACALGLAILLTGSRGAWVGLVAAVGLTWLLSRGKLLKLRSALVVSIVVIIGIAGLYRVGVIDEWMVQRVLTLPSVEATRGGSGRTDIWAVGWEMVKSNPLIGVGLQNFPTRFEDYIDVASLRGAYGVYPGRDPHSIFLSVQAELGIIGLVVFLMFLWAIFGNLSPHRCDSRAILGILLLTFMVFSGISGTILYRKFFWFALGLATAIPIVITREEA